MECYLDNSATTRAFDDVADAVRRAMLVDYGNPSSLHKKGVEAERLVKEARRNIADSLKVDDREIIFTSGGTESNNLALIGTALAIWLYWNFVGWLSILNCALPPIGIIVILDFFRNKFKYNMQFHPQTVNWFNVAGIVIGAVAANMIHWGIAAVNARAVAAVIYFIGEAVRKTKR